MPKFSAGFVRDFDLCECSWNDCAAIQEKVARHCVESAANDVALGFVKITATHSNNRLRGCIKRLLNYRPKNGKEDSDFIVARHHWNRQVLDYNGIDDRTLVLGSQKIQFPKILGEGGQVKQLNSRMPEILANALGYREDSERCSSKRNVKEYSLFIQSPTAPRATVKLWLLSLLSDRSTRQVRAQAPLVTPASTLPQRHDAFTSPGMEPHQLQFQISPTKSVICLGLKNHFLEAFANQGLGQRGFVSQHFSYHHFTKTWHSPLCSRSLKFRREELSLVDQCSNCSIASLGVKMQNFQSMYLASTIEALSPVCSLEQVEIILRRQFEHLGGATDTFKICPAGLRGWVRDKANQH